MNTDKRSKESKKLYHNRDFHDLQMKWYKKLDDTGFIDVERSGRNRQSIFDEYGGILQRPQSVLRHSINDLTLSHFIDCGKFSHFRGDFAVLDRIWQELILKKPKNKIKKYNKGYAQGIASDETKLNQLKQADPADLADSPVSNLTENQIESIRAKVTGKAKPPKQMSKTDRVILRLHSEGVILKDITKYLRRYYSHKRTRTKYGKPFSIFYIHKRLKYLNNIMSIWRIFDRP